MAEAAECPGCGAELGNVRYDPGCDEGCWRRAQRFPTSPCHDDYCTKTCYDNEAERRDERRHHDNEE